MSQKQIYIALVSSFAILISVLIYATYRSITPDARFWDSFWPNFWSDLIVGIIVAAIISWAITKSKRMEAGVVANANELGADIVANEIKTRGATHLIKFSVRNTCNHCFGNEGMYWHLFIERDCFIDISVAKFSELNHKADREINGKYFSHYSGLLSSPVFPKRYVEIASVTVTAPRNRETDLRYFLSTANGLFPRKMRYNERGDPDLNYLGKVITKSDAA